MNYSAPQLKKLSKFNTVLETTSNCRKYCPAKYKSKKNRTRCKGGYCSGGYFD